MNAPDIPDPNKAAIQGTIADVENYPFSYLINALSQTGGKTTIDGKTYDFTGLGTADVTNQMSDEMAQVLLDIQKGLGPEFIKQRIENLKQADPNGYAARKQLFDTIITEANNTPPNQALSESVQQSVLSELQRGARLDAKQIEEVQQGVRGGQIARGNYLGNAALQQESEAVVNAGSDLKKARQAAASDFTASGVSPDDIRYRKLQTDLGNLGAFLSNQTPTSQFASLSGAQNQGAPTPDTGYTMPHLDPGGSAGRGIQNSLDIYSSQVNWSNNNVNPFIAGLNTGSNVLGTAFDLGYNPWNQVRQPPANVYPGSTASMGPGS